jgi:hypothetical protein
VTKAPAPACTRSERQAAEQAALHQQVEGEPRLAQVSAPRSEALHLMMAGPGAQGAGGTGWTGLGGLGGPAESSCRPGVTVKSGDSAASAVLSSLAYGNAFASPLPLLLAVLLKTEQPDAPLAGATGASDFQEPATEIAGPWESVPARYVPHPTWLLVSAQRVIRSAGKLVHEGGRRGRRPAACAHVGNMTRNNWLLSCRPHKHPAMLPLSFGTLSGQARHRAQYRAPERLYRL